MTLTVNIGNTLSVNIEDGTGVDRTNYNFGTLNLGQSSVNTGTIRIDNESSGLLQTYQLSIGDTGGGMILRTTTGALAQDEYRVSALFETAQPAHAGFDNASADADNDVITGSPKTAQADDGGAQVFVRVGTVTGQDGVSVNDTDTLGEVTLWLRLEAPPTGSSVSGTQTDFATVYVNATAG